MSDKIFSSQEVITLTATLLGANPQDLIEKIEDNDLVFGVKSETSVAQVLRRVLVKTGLDMKYESNDTYMINTHSFRAYGITKLSRHDPNFAKKIAGQKGYLDQYDRLNDDEKLAIYQKYESDLIIDNTEKQKVKIKELEVERAEWKKELEKEQQDYVKKLKAEILAEVSAKTMSLDDEIEKIKKNSKK